MTTPQDTTAEVIDFPEVFEGTLDQDELDRLLLDARHASRLLDVRLKGGEQRRSEGGDLAAAREALRSGKAIGVQILYEFQGRRWLDTILRAPAPHEASYRLVRVAAPGG